MKHVAAGVFGRGWIKLDPTSITTLVFFQQLALVMTIFTGAVTTAKCLQLLALVATSRGRTVK